MFYLLHFHDRFMIPATLKVSQGHVTEVVATYTLNFTTTFYWEYENLPAYGVLEKTPLQGLSQFLCRTYGRTGDWQSDAALWWQVWRYSDMTLGRMTLVTTPCNRCLTLYEFYQASNIMDHLSWKLMLLVTSGRLCSYSRLDSCHRKTRHTYKSHSVPSHHVVQSSSGMSLVTSIFHDQCRT